MAKFNLTLPKMGESVDEATIVSWLKNVGDEVSTDDFVVEIATDKVDSEVPTEVEGVIVEHCFKVNDVVKVGDTLCVIETTSDVEKNINEEIKVDESEIAEIPNIEMLPENVNKNSKIEQIDDGYVEWGISESLQNTTYANSESSESGNYIFTATLNELTPNTKYYYRVVNENTYSDTYSFYTEDIINNEASTKMIAMSDMQTDASFPNKFYEVVHDGVLTYVENEFGGEINESINLVLIPGDLVSNGLSYNQWQDDFFNQADPLFSFVPVYPVPGNHENNSPFFFQYFDLPLNGTPGYEEHWWFKDISNVRIIGLDSNGPYQITCLLYTSPSPRDLSTSRMPSSA